MKTFHYSIKWAAMCLYLVQVFSCTKTIDTSKDSISLQTSNDLTSQAKKCRIVSFTQNNVPIGSGSRTVDVYYNRHGDIDSMIADVATGSLGAHLFYFTYDNNHRLIAYREDAGESYPYQEVHTYAYEKGRIVRDSVRIYPDGTSTDVKTLQYDRQGRVIKESRLIINDDGTVVDNIEPLIFSYNDEGNLVFGSATCDDGVNFLTTSEQLMFTQRDYSRNNRLGATAYNDSGLPLGFVEGIPATYGPSSLLSFGLPVEIEYDCNKPDKTNTIEHKATR